MSQMDPRDALLQMQRRVCASFSVCLSVGQNREAHKTAEPIGMLFGICSLKTVC